MIAWLLLAAHAAPQHDEAAAEVLDAAVRAHGLARDAPLELAFSFRGTPYRLHLDGDDVRYERTVQTDAGPRTDRLRGGSFEARLADAPLTVAPAQAEAWRRSLNSVAYFATLPRPLFDDAVIAKSLGRTTLGGRAWDTVEIRFREEGGGDDHDDVFRYWFDPSTHELGFLAYAFATNRGGVRLRRVIDRHEVAGVVLVDWANHGLDGPGHTIDEAVAAWEAGSLPELSRIELDDVTVTATPGR